MQSSPPGCSRTADRPACKAIVSSLLGVSGPRCQAVPVWSCRFRSTKTVVGAEENRRRRIVEISLDMAARPGSDPNPPGAEFLLVESLHDASVVVQIRVRTFDSCRSNRPGTSVRPRIDDRFPGRLLRRRRRRRRHRPYRSCGLISPLDADFCTDDTGHPAHTAARRSSCQTSGSPASR